MGIQIDWINELLLITSPQTEVDLQSLHDYVEDERGMASPVGLIRSAILSPEGKIEDPTNPGVYSQIILVMQSPWQIQFWGGSGYTRVYGGKIVGGLSDQPILATGTAGDVTVLESPVDGVYVAPSGADAQTIADAVWDEPLTGATHNIPTSSGRRLRSLGDTIPASVVDVTPSTAVFDTDLPSAVDDFYNDQTIRFTSGNLDGQLRIVLDYDGTNKTVTVDEPWTEAPANGDEFDLLPQHAHPVSQIAEGVWVADVATHSGTVGSFAEMLEFIANIEGGRWQIVANQMLFYAEDNITEVARFNLYDSGGSPAMTDVYERTRV